MMRRYGFTMMELLVAILIFSMIIGGIFGALSVARQSWHTGNTQVELQQQTRRAMHRMIRELRESGSLHVSITGGGSIITFQVPIDDDITDLTADDDVLDVNGDIEWGAEGNLGWSIRYFLNNQQLLRRILDGYPNGNQQGTDLVLANDIRSDTPPPNALNFGNPAGDLTVINIEITAEKVSAPGRTMQSTLNSQATLRNSRP